MIGAEGRLLERPQELRLLAEERILPDARMFVVGGEGLAQRRTAEDLLQLVVSEHGRTGRAGVENQDDIPIGAPGVWAQAIHCSENFSSASMRAVAEANSGSWMGQTMTTMPSTPSPSIRSMYCLLRGSPGMM